MCTSQKVNFRSFYAKFSDHEAEGFRKERKYIENEYILRLVSRPQGCIFYISWITSARTINIL